MIRQEREKSAILKWGHLLQRCLDKGKDFNLTVADVKKLLARKTCFYSGVVMSDGGLCNTKRTIDRVDSSLGYVKGNVVACTLRMNSVKGDATVSELSLLLKALR